MGEDYRDPALQVNPNLTFCTNFSRKNLQTNSIESSRNQCWDQPWQDPERPWPGSRQLRIPSRNTS